MLYIFTKEFWPSKEVKNQALHFSAGTVLSILSYRATWLICTMFLTVITVAFCIEVYQYVKEPSKEKLVDCIRDFVFYILAPFMISTIL